jgi:HK97 family phage major capsid protein
MDKIAELRAKRAEKVDAFTALAEKMNGDDYVEGAEDQSSYDEIKGEIATLDAKIKRAEDANKLKASSAIVVPGQDKVYATPKTFYGKLKAFRGQNAEDAAYRSGMFIRATMFRNEAAQEWCRENGVVIGKAQAEGTNTAGGFLVIPEFERAIIDLREEVGTFRQNVRMIPMGSDSLSIPRRTGGVTAYFVGENAQITASQKGWGQVNLAAKKIGALSLTSTELAEDAIINIADDLAQEMAYAFAAKEDACGWNGDGTSTYGGISGVRTKIIDGTHTASAIDGASNHDTFGEIDATDLANVMGALPKYAERNAKWYCSQTAWATVFQRLIAASGGVTLSEITGGKPTRRYLGYEVVIDQTLPTSTSDLSNVAMIFFGDLSLAATMGERRGIRVKTSDDRYFEYDQIGIQATERVDINVHDLGDNTTAGPLIALIGE